MAKVKSLSIVLIGLNEEQFLDKTILSCLSLVENTITLGKYEILYIDSNSTDNSLKIVEKYNVDRYILTGDKSAAAARKVGELNAKYEFILFLDGDMEVNKDFINNVEKYIEKTNDIYSCGFIGLRNDINYDGINVIGKIKNYYRSYKPHQTLHIGGALLIKKELLISVGGYEPILKSSEEPFLLIKLLEDKQRIMDIAKPFITHHNSKINTYKKKIKTLINPNASSFYFGLSFVYAIHNKSFRGLIKVFKYTLLIWLFDLLFIFAILGYKLSYFFLAIIFVLVVSKNFKLFITGNFRLYGFFLAIFKEKKLFKFRYKKIK